eukprot:TCONS_00006917-protein
MATTEEVTPNTTTTLILGASGNTGRRLVEQLLADKQNVKAIVRSKERFQEIIPDHEQLQVIESTALEMTDADFKEAVTGCNAVVSCLGHNLTLKGVYGKPRALVTDSLKKVCTTIQELDLEEPVKVVLMGSNGVANPKGTDNTRPLRERFLLSAVRALTPPHRDNEAAAAYLSKDIGEEASNIEWVVVRPDGLIEGDVSKYEVFDKPLPGLFGGGETTRANVAHFMKTLILNDDMWKKWLYQMPVPENIKEVKKGEE